MINHVKKHQNFQEYKPSPFFGCLPSLKCTHVDRPSNFRHQGTPPIRPKSTPLEVSNCRHIKPPYYCGGFVNSFGGKLYEICVGYFVYEGVCSVSTSCKDARKGLKRHKAHCCPRGQCHGGESFSSPLRTYDDGLVCG